MYFFFQMIDGIRRVWSLGCSEAFETPLHVFYGVFTCVSPPKWYIPPAPFRNTAVNNSP